MNKILRFCELPPLSKGGQKRSAKLMEPHSLSEKREITM